jgi:hypothetical protein
MSSSRSIAAARNRRSGDTSQQQQQINRPGTSIASQAALQGGGSNRRLQSQQTQQPLQQQQQQQPQSSQPARVKLSVSDAIGLITLRLGRVEQILIDQEGAALNGGSSLSIPDGTQLVDKSVFNSIINRLEAAESKGKTITTYEKELKELRETHLKHEASVKKSFEDVDAAFVDLESQVQLQGGERAETTVDVVTPEEVIVDLKSLVQQDLLA